MKTKLVYFGSTALAAKILETLAAEYEIPLVVTQPDKPVGRKKIMQQTAVAETAAALGLQIFKPQRLKDPGVADRIFQMEPEAFVVAAYGKIIPQNILDIPQKGAINIHPSLLPKYRGPAPIITPVLEGARTTGVSIMLMDAEMDHGPLLAAESLEIGETETAPHLENRLADLSIKLIKEELPDYLAGNLQPVPQDHAQATYTKMIDKEAGKIDWRKNALEIYNQYRAFAAWPQIWTVWKGKTLKIFPAKPEAAQANGEKLVPGTVLKNNAGVFVQTGGGALEILELQLEGKNKIAAADFVNGHKDFIGSVFA